MRNTRALAAAGAAVAVLGLAAPTATAGGDHNQPSNIVALPSVIARGGQMTVTVDGCPQGGTMTSDAFRTTHLTPVRGANETSIWRATRCTATARAGPRCGRPTASPTTRPTRGCGRSNPTSVSGVRARSSRRSWS